MIDLAKIIIDRSNTQIEARVNAMRAELMELGYSVVSTNWLRVKLAEPVRKRRETA